MNVATCAEGCFIFEAAWAKGLETWWFFFSCLQEYLLQQRVSICFEKQKIFVGYGSKSGSMEMAMAGLIIVHAFQVVLNSSNLKGGEEFMEASLTYLNDVKSTA